MPPIKELALIANKWVRQSQASPESYAEGVRNPRIPWKNAAQAGTANYKQAMAASLAEDRHAKGINRATEADWQDNAIKKGVTRWPEGIRLGSENFASGFEPFRQVIASTQLPARGPKGAPGNIQRVATLAAALHNKKKQLMAQG